MSGSFHHDKKLKLGGAGASLPAPPNGVTVALHPVSNDDAIAGDIPQFGFVLRFVRSLATISAKSDACVYVCVVFCQNCQPLW